MVLAIYQIILHQNKITECLKMTTFKIVFTFDVFFSAETTMHCDSYMTGRAGVWEADDIVKFYIALLGFFPATL
jgi:hypothetical protein